MTFDEHIDAIIDEHGRAVKRSAQLTALERTLYKDHGLNVSWDGLRNFWNVELTTSAAAERDELCRFEADIVSKNAKLVEIALGMLSYLREAERIHDAHLIPDGYVTQLRELGIEVE